METDDILTNQMQIRRPVLLEQIARFAITLVTDAGDVVGQSVQPYIGHMLRIKGYRNTPGERSTGNTQILQTRQKEIVHHLIFTGNRLNKLRMSIDMLDQTISIFAHFKEVSFLFSRCTGTSAVGAFAVYQLRLRKERLAGSTVHTLIVTFVDIALIVELFENLLYLFLMILVCGTDKLIIGSVHQIPDGLDLSGHIVYIFLRCDAGFLRFQLDLLSMLVGTGLEKHIIALLSFKTGDGICQNYLVGVADMRLAGRIGDRRCHIIFSSVHFILLSICLVMVCRNENPGNKKAPSPWGKTSISRVTTSVRHLFTKTASSGTAYPPAITGGTCRSLSVRLGAPLRSHVPDRYSCTPLSLRGFSVTVRRTVLFSSQCLTV